MKFFAAFALLATAVSADQSKMIKSLMKSAFPTGNGRQLEQNADEYAVNIASYSVKFEQCQFVKSYDDNMADNEEGEDTSTVLSTQRFVIFRLCPSDCGNCNYNYGEYLVDLETYLQSTVDYFQNYQEQMCNACDECGNNQYQNQDGDQYQQNDNNNGERKLEEYYETDCDTCYDECQKIANMEENGYVDASEFLDCDMIYDPEDDNRMPLYAGPICASSGSKIKIGVFTDQYCLHLDTSKDVEDYLVGDNGQLRLSHALLKNTYTDTCISCKEPQDNQDNNQGNDYQDADEVSEMCEELYTMSAKCEKTHGFDDGYGNYYGYENQLSQEETVCDFMSSLKSGTYDEEGEIMVSGANRVARSDSTTGGQKFALTFFILGTVGLAVYAAMLHSKLVKGKTDLSSSGGAMA